MARDTRILPFVAFLALAAAPAARAADPFYEVLLSDGIDERQDGDAERAAKLLRLACFGFLEQPPALAGCLTQLALAQAETGGRQAFGEAFLRIAEVERLFGGYSRADLQAADRRLFESRASELVSPEVLAGSGRFRLLAPDDAGVEAPVRGRPRAAQPEAPPAPAASLDRPLPDEVAAAISRAREAGSSGARDVLERELERLRPLADRSPEIPQLQHAAGELAYRLRRWRESRDFFERGGEIDPGEPALAFYFAVALYETGAKEQAADVLRECLPGLRQDPFVDEYAAKILASGER